MRCLHIKVEGGDWEKCPKCGKIVKANRARLCFRVILVLFTFYYVKPKLFNWIIDILNFTNSDCVYWVDIIVGCLLLVALLIIFYFFLPAFDEKNNE